MALLVPPYSDMRIFSLEVSEDSSSSCLASSINAAEHEVYLSTSEELVKEGINVEIINVHTIKPLDEETILTSLRKTRACVVCENHNLVGGLFSAVSELVVEKLPMRVHKIGIPDRFGEVGKMPYLKEVMGMTSLDIIKAIRSALNDK